VFWIHASNTARLEAGYKSIADRLDLHGRNDATVNVAQLVNNWLCSEASGRWLMIIDGADDMDVLYIRRRHGQGAATNNGHISRQRKIAVSLPQSQNGAILITSRNTDVATKLKLRRKDIIPVGAMNEDQALQLLQNKLSDDLDATAPELLTELDCMPLAITQVADHISKESPRTTVATYVQELRTSNDQKVKLLRQAAKDAHSANSILDMWQITFERIREKSHTATDLLSFMSFFNPHDIPESILLHYLDKNQNVAQRLGRLFHHQGDDIRKKFNEDLNVLRSYSLVTTKRGDAFEMYGLVQLAIRRWLRYHGREDALRQMFLSTLLKEFPTGEYGNWKKCEILLPHVMAAATIAITEAEESRTLARILHNAAWYMRNRGNFVQAEGMTRGSIIARMSALALEHIKVDTQDSVNMLAVMLKDLGRYKEAEAMSRKALRRREISLGKEHLDTLSCVNTLANVLRVQGKYEDARKMNLRALSGRRKLLGEEHPDTLSSVNNLANVLRDEGKYEEAEAEYVRALKGRLKKFGKKHPDTLASLNNLACVLRDKGKYEEAETKSCLALEGRMEVLGEEHPDTLTSMINLASILRDQQKYAEAQEMNRKALEGCKRTLGEDHPFTRTAADNLLLGPQEDIRERISSHVSGMRIR